jgi:ribosomal protein L17
MMKDGDYEVRKKALANIEDVEVLKKLQREINDSYILRKITARLTELGVQP